MLAVITYMGFGTPFIYMGQEVGLTNCDFRNIDEMKDPVSHFVYDLMRGYGIPKSLAFRFIKYGARDHARTPMQWNDTANGGFNEGHETWQGVNGEYKKINVEKDLASDRSIYRFYQKLIGIKKTNETAVYGKTEEYDHDNRKVVAFSRTYQGKRLFVAGNFSKKKVIYRLPEWVEETEVLLNNYKSLNVSEGKITLEPYQAVVWEKA